MTYTRQLAAYHNMDKQPFIMHVNPTSSTVFLTIKVITSSTKWYSLKASSFTYVYANQWGTLKQNITSLKTLGPNHGME